MTTLLNIFLILSSICLALAALLTIIRILRGPSTANRVVGLDLLNSVAVGLVVIFSIWRNQSIYLDIILGFVLVIFLGTVAYAQYIGSKEKE